MLEDPDSIEYCFAGECWPIEEFTVEDGTLGWRSPNGWRVQFTRDGENLRGKLNTGQGTNRSTMKRM